MYKWRIPIVFLYWVVGWWVGGLVGWGLGEGEREGLV